MNVVNEVLVRESCSCSDRRGWMETLRKVKNRGVGGGQPTLQIEGIDVKLDWELILSEAPIVNIPKLGLTSLNWVFLVHMCSMYSLRAPRLAAPEQRHWFACD